MSLTVEQASYLAGVIDGEGHIGLSVRRRADGGNSYDFRLKVTNTKRAWLEHLSGWVQGSIYRLTNSRYNKVPCYDLRWRGAVGRQLLTAVMPYLQLKRRHAELMIRYFDAAARRKNGSLFGNVRDLQATAEVEEIHAALKMLNSRGVVPHPSPGAPRTSRMCSLDGCDRPHFSNGYCRRHYRKFIERGGPTHYEGKCEWCNRPFVSRYKSRRFCSRACGNLAYVAKQKSPEA